MTKTFKARLGIAAATTVCIFTLASVFTSTIAWFAAERSVHMTGMSFTVTTGETDLNSMTVHKCNLSASTSSVLVFNSTPSVTATGHGSVATASGIEMENYSTLNQTQPVLLLLTFNSGITQNDIDMTATSNTGSFVSSATAQNIGAFPFSSAVRFKVATYSVNSFPFNNVQVSDYSSDKSFVTLTKNGEGQVTSTSFNSNITFYDGNSNTPVTYLAIILNYYPDAIDYIISQTNFEVFQNHNNCINFFCDWIMEL